MKKKKISIAILSVSILVILLLSLILIVRNQKPKSKEIILAKVGDKTISLNEFIGRAEYTLRPQYCKGSDNISKKVVLNSLIAEKMFALEAGDTNKLAQNERFQRFIEGRKQQAMREWLFHKEGFEKVKVDTSEIKKIYQLAGRKYRVTYYSLNNDSLAELIGKELSANKELFGPIYFELSGSDTIPGREVDYNVRESEIVHKALFSEKLNVGDVIGPLKTGDGSYLVMRVNGWVDSHVMTETDVSRRWNDVKEELTNQKATRIYEEYVAGVMKGRRIDFFPDTFHKMVDVIGPQYFSALEKDKELFMNKAFDKEIENIAPDIGKQIEDFIDEPLFQVDGKIWTVRDFGEEIEVHPLVYRNKKMPKNDFANQFKLAIVDMIRDKYLAGEAYKAGYDKVGIVSRNVGMWRDASIALYHKGQYLKKVNSGETNPLVQIEKYLNPYINELQQQYAAEIEVNVEEFDKINLTRTDMFVTQSNVPFPIMVPSFPQLTTDYKLDYGKRMKTDQNEKIQDK